MESQDTSKANVAPGTDDELQKLRTLLLGAEQDKALKKLASQGDLQQISSVLSEAMIQRNNNDGSIAEALAPIMDDAFNSAINRSPVKISNAIYPIIGPSIRKAVAKALSEFVQSLNTVLENSLSIRAWGWRYQAWRTGMRYGEFVLSKTIDFRVEQILLIHRETGLLLHSESLPGTLARDPDLVSSMLTAINDFVMDSFQEREGSGIENVQVGQFTLQIEASPTAMLVAAVRGTPGEAVRNVLRQAMERIHMVFNQELLEFTGEVEVFRGAADILHPCLIQKAREKTKTSAPWLGIIAIGIVIAFLIITTYHRYVAEQQREAILHTVSQTPGYVLLRQTSSLSNKTMRLELLRAPNSLRIESFRQQLETTGWQINAKAWSTPLDLASHLSTFLDEVMQLPDGVITKLEGDTLTFSGLIGQADYQRLQSSTFLNTHFSDIDFSQMKILPPAPEPTPQEVQAKRWFELKAQIENIQLTFIPNEAKLAAGEKNKLTAILAQLAELEYAQQVLAPLKWQLIITGFADRTGTDAINAKLSLERAEVVKDLLVANGVEKTRIVAFGAGYVEGSTLPGKNQRIADFKIFHTPIARN